MDTATTTSAWAGWTTSTSKRLPAAALFRVPTWLFLLRVEGDSMSPTLEDGDFVLGLSTRLLPARAGRIAAFRRDEQLLIKRALTREQSEHGAAWFVVGDQPARSQDSRRFGAVPEALIEAVAVCSWSPKRLRLSWLL